MDVAPNLLLVIVDDLRADRVGFAGDARAETPHLDALAAGGVTWSHCWSTCGWTLPACASILTGQLPAKHGLLHHDGRFQVPKLPELLGEAWATLGIGNNGNLVPDDLSVETLDGLGLPRRPAAWKHFGWQEGFETYRWFPKQDDDGPFRALTGWLAEHATDPRPWFAMLHTNLVHDYDESHPWAVEVDRFLGRPLPSALHEFRDGPSIWREPPAGLTSAELSEALQAKYAGCVAEADRRLGTVLASIDLESTVVAVVGDHGEGFDGETDRVHHCGRLHDDLLRVPLLLHFPASTPGVPAPGSTIDTPCSVIDLVPTLLALAGVEGHDLPGADLRDLPLARTLVAEDHGYLFVPAHTGGKRLERFERARDEVELRMTLRWPHKRIEARLGPERWSEEYDLLSDPLEQVNRSTGAQAPRVPPRAGEGRLVHTLRARAPRSPEARLQDDAQKWPGDRPGLQRRRPLPPVEPHVRFSELEDTEPISFVVAVDDPVELRRHLLRSEAYRHGAHQWILVENQGNRVHGSISHLYVEASERAQYDLQFFLHQDVLLPPDWEARLFRALRDLERRDPGWGVIGAAGRAPQPGDGSEPPNIGHWSDPHGYHAPPSGGLPQRVQVLDELWLGMRAARGLTFDPNLPGFHCYGADLCMTARSRGLHCYVVDAPVIHKLVRPDGTLITRSEQSHKITSRRTAAFHADFKRSADHVAGKWSRYLPFQSTCHAFTAP